MNKLQKIGAVGGAGIALGLAIAYGRETGYDLAASNTKKAVEQATSDTARNCKADMFWQSLASVTLSTTEVPEYTSTNRAGNIATDPLGSALMSSLSKTGLKKVVIYAGNPDIDNIAASTRLHDEMSMLESDITTKISETIDPIAAQNITFQEFVKLPDATIPAGGIVVDAFAADCISPVTTAPAPTK